MVRAVSGLALVVALGVLWANLSALNGQEKAKAAAARNFEVRMKDAAFDQKDITIAPGDTVRWVNEDDVTHSVTSDSGSAITIPEIIVNSGKHSDRIPFATEGVFKYHCKFHTMNGTVTVKK